MRIVASRGWRRLRISSATSASCCGNRITCDDIVVVYVHVAEESDLVEIQGEGECYHYHTAHRAGVEIDDADEYHRAAEHVEDIQPVAV